MIIPHQYTKKIMQEINSNTKTLPTDPKSLHIYNSSKEFLTEVLHPKSKKHKNYNLIFTYSHPHTGVSLTQELLYTVLSTHAIPKPFLKDIYKCYYKTLDFIYKTKNIQKYRKYIDPISIFTDSKTGCLRFFNTYGVSILLTDEFDKYTQKTDNPAIKKLEPLTTLNPAMKECAVRVFEEYGYSLGDLQFEW
jgi:hypothetical protein